MTLAKTSLVIVLLMSLAGVSFAQGCQGGGSPLPLLDIVALASQNGSSPMPASSVTMNPGDNLDLYVYAQPVMLVGRQLYLLANVMPTGMSPMPFGNAICMDLTDPSFVLLPLGVSQPETTLAWSFNLPASLAGTSIHAQVAMLVPGGNPSLIPFGYLTTDPIEVILH